MISVNNAVTTIIWYDTYTELYKYITWIKDHTYNAAAGDCQVRL